MTICAKILKIISYNENYNQFGNRPAVTVTKSERLSTKQFKITSICIELKILLLQKKLQIQKIQNIVFTILKNFLKKMQNFVKKMQIFFSSFKR